MAEEFQQGAFAGSVLTYDADDVALLYLEVDIFQCPYIVGMGFLTAVVDFAYLEVWVFLTSYGGLPETIKVML
jgi:hypothetical protein